ncbi:MAG: nucleoside hydrolase-like domain-containing protein [Spirochaetota bacterium]
MQTTYRVLVSTDLGGDPDDTQSLIHLLHYSDILEIEGIVSTAGPGSEPRVEEIDEWVRRVDLDYLRDRGFPELASEADVLSLLRQGAVAARAPGPDGATDGSRLIVERAMAPDPRGLDRPLWVLMWGSMTDLAQALYDEPAIATRIRVNAIGSSNTVNDPSSRDFVYDGMADRWPELWWIEDGVLPKLSHDTFRGYYQGGEQGGIWGNVAFVEEVIRGKGTTSRDRFGERLGDAMPVATWPAGTLKEGDTPTFTYLLSPVVGGVGDVDDPTAESWGGTFGRPAPERYPNYYCDLDEPPEVCQATISRFRVDYLGDWKRRWERYG